jgi:hypothetical protein
MIDYKIQERMKDFKRVDGEVITRFKELAELEKASQHLEYVNMSLYDMDQIPKSKGLFSHKVTISEKDFDSLMSLAREALNLRMNNYDLKATVNSYSNEIGSLKKALDDLARDTKDFRTIRKHAPSKVEDFLYEAAKELHLALSRSRKDRYL